MIMNYAKHVLSTKRSMYLDIQNSLESVMVPAGSLLDYQYTFTGTGEQTTQKFYSYRIIRYGLHDDIKAGISVVLNENQCHDDEDFDELD